jgi:hypothetical protein
MTDFATLPPSRESGFRFDLLDEKLNVIGKIEPVMDNPPAISNDTGRQIMRDMRGLVLPPGTADQLNPYADRVRPVMIHDGVEWPMGVFLFVAGSSDLRTFGTTFSGGCADQGIILDQPIESSFGVATGGLPDSVIADLFIQAGFTPAQFSIDTGAMPIGNPIAWPAGTSRLRIINDLAALGGCFPAFFTNAGIGRILSARTLPGVETDLIYDINRNIEDGTIVETDGTLTAPNRYIVIESGATQAPVTGVYDLPDDAPNSYANIGYRRAKVITEQGLIDSLAATERAYAAAQYDARNARRVSFGGIIDPRHDTFDLVDFLGYRYREVGWRTTLIEGAQMAHELTRIWEV